MNVEGNSKWQISKILKVSNPTVHVAILKNEIDGTFTAKELWGKPRSTTSRDDHIIHGTGVLSLMSSIKKIEASFAHGRKKYELNEPYRGV